MAYVRTQYVCFWCVLKSLEVSSFFVISNNYISQNHVKLTEKVSR